MTNTLQEKLNEILTDKNTNLLPENLKKGIKCLGVDGTFEEKVKLFNTVEEMNSSTGNSEGTLAVVYGQNYENFASDSAATALWFDETIVLDVAQTEDDSMRLTGMLGDNFLDGNAEITSTSFDFYASTHTVNCSVKYTSTDGITYTRTSIKGADEVNPNKITLDVPMEFMPDSKPYNKTFGKFIKIPMMFFEGIFSYSKNNSGILEWVFAPNQFSATAEYVYKKNFFGKDGAATGTMLTIADKGLRDTTASACNDIIGMYSMMEPIVVTAEDISSYKYRWASSIPIKYDGTPLLDTSNLTSLNNFLDQNRGIKYIPKLDTSNVTMMNSAFSTNPELLYVADGMDLSNCTRAQNVLSACMQLVTAPKFLNTGKVTSFWAAFEGDTALVNVPLYDTNSCTNMGYMFNDCPNLSDESLNNILQMCTNTSRSYSDIKTLARVGLTSEQATKCTTLSNYSAFTAAGWTTGY
jgi:hypothetical protein